MRYLLLLFLTGFVISCSSEDKEEKEPITRFPTLKKIDGLYYEKDSDELVNGTVLSEYENGNAYVKANFKNGKLHGTYKAGYMNGRQMGESNYKEGELHGASKSWYENGQFASQVNFVSGKEEGRYISYYPTGQQKIEAFFKEGKLDSTYKKWEMSGELVFIDVYENGRQVKRNYFN